MDINAKISAAAEYILSQTDLRPTIGLVLGSGLGDYADSPRWAAFGVTYRRALDLMDQTAAGNSQLLRRVLPDEVRLTDEGSQTAILGWEAAAAILESLGDYEDAPAKIDECYHNAAALKLAEGNMEGAAAYAEKMSEKEAARLLAEIQAAEG